LPDKCSFCCPQDPDIVPTSEQVDVQPCVPDGMGRFGRDGRLILLSDGDKIDVLDLSTDAEQAWTAFLREHRCL
jgi:hypothetical protein